MTDLQSLSKRLRIPLSKTELVICLLVLNLFVMAGLAWKVETTRPPVIATVAVSQLSRMYGQQFAADPGNTPEMVKLKTDLFMATTEKLLAQAAQKKGMVVFARECVLTGDTVDLTPQVVSSVDEALKSGSLNSQGGGHAVISLKP